MSQQIEHSTKGEPAAQKRPGAQPVLLWPVYFAIDHQPRCPRFYDDKQVSLQLDFCRELLGAHGNAGALMENARQPSGKCLSACAFKAGQYPVLPSITISH